MSTRSDSLCFKLPHKRASSANARNVGKSKEAPLQQYSSDHSGGSDRIIVSVRTVRIFCSLMCQSKQLRISPTLSAANFGVLFLKVIARRRNGGLTSVTNSHRDTGHNLSAATFAMWITGYMCELWPCSKM